MCGMGGMGLYLNIFTQYVPYMYVKKNIYSIYNVPSHPLPRHIAWGARPSCLLKPAICSRNSWNKRLEDFLPGFSNSETCVVCASKISNKCVKKGPDGEKMRKWEYISAPKPPAFRNFIKKQYQSPTLGYSWRKQKMSVMANKKHLLYYVGVPLPNISDHKHHHKHHLSC